MQKLFLLIIAAFIFQTQALVAQSGTAAIEKYLNENAIKASITSDNIYYSIDTHGNGEKPQAQDYVLLNYKGYLLNGTLFDESTPDEPFVFQLGYRQVIKGWEDGITQFDIGSKGKLFIPSEMGYGTHGAGTAIPPNTPLMFEIELLDILNQRDYDDYMVELEEKERQAYIKHVKDQIKTDKKIIQNFALDHKLKTKRSNSGLSYVITKKGKGENAKVGDRLLVHYEGVLENDEIFDSSYEKKEPFEFILGAGKVIHGWEEGLTHFNKGAEGWLLIPSKLAYGPRAIKEGKTNIPADSSLFFKIKVVNISQPSN